MGKGKWVMVLAAVGVLAGVGLPRLDAAETYRWSRLPSLAVQPPEAVAAVADGAFGPWRPTDEQIERAVEQGRQMAERKVPARQVLTQWRVLVDKGSEYATFLSPEAVACMVGYQAGQRSLSNDELQPSLAEVVNRFSSGICIYIELRSYAHESGDWGEIKPGTPAEAYEALFLLDAGGRKLDGMTVPVTEAAVINSNGLHYEPIDLPDVRASTTWGHSYGANYYVWWPFKTPDGKPAFGERVPSALQLTVITPTRERKYTFNLISGKEAKR